jgi:mRNA interferase MazF
MRRGEIWWAALSSPRRSEPGFRRPVVIIQADAFTRSRLSTVIVAIITSNVRLGEAPGNVPLSKAASRLPRESVVNVSQVLTLDKAFLKERVGSLPPEAMAAVDEGLRLVLSLTSV